MCWPKRETIAADLKMDELTISRAVSKLAGLGRITIKRSPNRSNVYAIIDLDGLYSRQSEREIEPAPEPAEVAIEGDRNPLSEPPSEVIETHYPEPETPPQGDRNPLSNDLFGVIETDHRKESKKVRKDSKEERVLLAESELGTKSEIDAAASSVAQTWNATAEATGLSRIRVMTPARNKSLKARIREVGIEGMLGAIEAVAASSFCRGGNETGWRADFDFILQPKSLIRLLEGRYADKSGTGKSLSPVEQLRRDWNLPTFLGADVDDRKLLND